MARTKIHWTPETLATRWCGNFHVGNWVLRKDGTYACRDCSAESTKRFLAAKAGKEPKPRQDSVESLKNDLERLESALAIVREKLRLAEEIERLKAAYKSL